MKKKTTKDSPAKKITSDLSDQSVIIKNSPNLKIKLTERHPAGTRVYRCGLCNGISGILKNGEELATWMRIHEGPHSTDPTLCQRKNCLHKHNGNNTICQVSYNPLNYQSDQSVRCDVFWTDGDNVRHRCNKKLGHKSNHKFSKGFPHRIVLGEGYPCALGLGKKNDPYNAITMNKKPRGSMARITLDFPKELWNPDLPKYRLILECID